MSRTDAAKLNLVKYTLAAAIGAQANQHDRVELWMPTFNCGNTLDWLHWYQKFNELITMKNWTTGPVLFLNTRILLKGEAKVSFELAVNGMNQTVANHTLAMAEVAAESLDENPRETLMTMIREKRKDQNTTVKKFVKHLRELSVLVTLLPAGNNESIGNDTLLFNIKRGMPEAWRRSYDASGQRLQTISALSQYFCRQEKNNPIVEKNSRNENNNNRNGNHNKNNGNEKSATSKQNSATKQSAEQKPKVYCKYHKNNRHSSEDCWNLHPEKKPTGEANYLDFVDEEVNLIETLVPTNTSEPAPRLDTIARIANAKPARLVNALFDTGCSKSIVNASVLTDDLLKTMIPEKQTFKQANASLEICGTIKLDLNFVGFSKTRMVSWTFCVTRKLSYGIIVGRDLMELMKLSIDFTTKTLEWDGLTMPMRKTNLSLAERLRNALEHTKRAQTLAPRAQETKPRAQETKPRTQETKPRAHETKPKYDVHETGTIPGNKPKLFSNGDNSMGEYAVDDDVPPNLITQPDDVPPNLITQPDDTARIEPNLITQPDDTARIEHKLTTQLDDTARIEHKLTTQPGAIT